MSSSGETIAGYDVTSWYGIFGPAGIPAAVVSWLPREFSAMERKYDVAERLVAPGILPGGRKPSGLVQQVEQKIAR